MSESAATSLLRASEHATSVPQPGTTNADTRQREDDVHYSTGLGGLASLGGASLIAERTGAAPFARFLLEASGALFGFYLLVMVALSLVGATMRRGVAPAAPLTPPAAHLRSLTASRHAR
jgi:hypothetical protein